MDRLFIIGRDSVPASIEVGEGESLKLDFVILPGVSADTSLRIDINGPGAVVDLGGVYVCDGNTKASLNVGVRHNCGGSVSRQLFKGVASGNSFFRFGGLVYVAQDAQRTKAYQENHSLLLSPTACVETLPQLEIYADDVECSHGATTGFLSADEQFYMRSRGIPEQEARRLQVISFLHPVVSRLPEELQEELLERL